MFFLVGFSLLKMTKTVKRYVFFGWVFPLKMTKTVKLYVFFRWFSLLKMTKTVFGGFFPTKN